MTTPQTPPPEHKTGYWWFVLAFTGGLSLTFNLWMVIAPPKGVSAGEVAANMGLGIIVHASPVVLSALVSHGFKTPLLGEWEKKSIIFLFLLFMAMSVSHQAALLMAYLHWTWAWAMPFAIDAIALLALRAILAAARLNKEAREKADAARDMAAVEARLRPVIEKDIRREWEERLPALREDIARDLRPVVAKDITPALEDRLREDIGAEFRAELEARQADMDRQIEADRERLKTHYELVREDDKREIEQEVRGEFEAAWNAAEAGLRTQITAEVKRELTAGARSGGRKAIEAVSGGNLQLTSVERHAIARQLLEENPAIGPKALGEEIGLSAKQAGRIKKRLLTEMGLIDPDADGVEDDAEDAPEEPTGTRLRRVV